MKNSKIHLGTGFRRNARSPELVADLKAAAEAKRARKAVKLTRDAAMRDMHYYAAMNNPALRFSKDD